MWERLETSPLVNASVEMNRLMEGVMNQRKPDEQNLILVGQGLATELSLNTGKSHGP